MNYPTSMQTTCLIRVLGLLACKIQDLLHKTTSKIFLPAWVKQYSPSKMLPNVSLKGTLLVPFQVQCVLQLIREANQLEWSSNFRPNSCYRALPSPSNCKQPLLPSKKSPLWQTPKKPSHNGPTTLPMADTAPTFLTIVNLLSYSKESSQRNPITISCWVTSSTSSTPSLLPHPPPTIRLLGRSP